VREPKSRSQKAICHPEAQIVENQLIVAQIHTGVISNAVREPKSRSQKAICHPEAQIVENQPIVAQIHTGVISNEVRESKKDESNDWYNLHPFTVFEVTK
jgi:hypothetical protein